MEVEWRRGSGPKGVVHGEHGGGRGGARRRTWGGELEVLEGPRSSGDGGGGPRGRGDGDGVEGEGRRHLARGLALSLPWRRSWRSWKMVVEDVIDVDSLGIR